MKRPVWALHVLIVGLALHNLAMSGLWRLGVRGGALTVVSSWWDVLLLVALALVAVSRWRKPFEVTVVDWLALAFGAFVVLYGVIPQSVLDGAATHRGILYGARHDLLPVGGYFLGRGLDLTDRERSRLCRTMLATAAVVAAFGLVDVYAVPLSWWRGAAGWYRDQLGLQYGKGLSYLPQNFVYNVGNGVIFRRLTSTFLSPLASAYLLVVALFFVPLRARWGQAVAVLLFAAVLWSHTRAALIALVAGLLVIALVRRRWRLVAVAIAVAAISFAFVTEYSHFAPRAYFTPTELKAQEENAAKAPAVSNDATAVNESSTSEHLSSLREGVRTVVDHPWGYGLGNSGVTASRTGVPVKAGESTYTELGVETGIAGGVVFVLWCLMLARAALRRRVFIGAAFVAVLVLGLQTDVIGVPWIAISVWALAADTV